MNFVSEDLVKAIANQRSKSIRPDRQTLDLIQVGSSVKGGIVTEFQAGNIDTFIGGALCSDWVSPGTLAHDVSFVVEATPGVGGTVQFNALETLDLAIGQFIKLVGPLNAANTGFLQIKADLGSNQYQVYQPLANEGPVTAVLQGDRLRNGVTKRSFAIERANNDVSQFFSFLGMVVDTLELSLESGNPLGAKLAFIGKDSDIAQTTISNGAPSAAPTSSIINATSSVGEVKIDRVAITACLLQKLGVTISNQCQGKTGVGVEGFCDVNARSLAVTGNISMYFNDETYYNKYQNSESFGLSFQVQNTAGDWYLVEMPKCKFAEAAPNVSGKDEDVVLEGSYEAIVGTDGYTVQICRFLSGN